MSQTPIYRPYLSWDPGVQSGYALWKKDCGLPYSTGVISPPVGLEWQHRVGLVGTALQGLLAVHRPCVLWCEWPKYMESTEGGQKSARGGDLIKLAAAVGGVMQICYELGVPFVPVQINDWKGQMSKESVIHRIKRILGAHNCTGFRSHAWDAVGIGLHMQGRFGA